EDRSDDRAVLFGDPAALARRIVVRAELRDDVGDQRLEVRAPAVLLRVERAVAVDDPSEVPPARRTQRDLGGRAVPPRAEGADGFHRSNESALVGRRERGEQPGDELARTPVERCEGRLPFLRQGEEAGTAVLRGALALDQTAAAKRLQDPGEVAGIEPELGA